MKKLILCILISIAGPLLLAQNIEIRGRVMDEETGEYLNGASVFIDEVLQISDTSGIFTSIVPGAQFTIAVFYVGYEQFNATYETAQFQNRELIIKMSRKDQILSTTTITGSRFEKPILQSTVSLEVIRPYLIQNTNTISIDQVLQKMPGVDIIDGQANIRGGSGFSYGAGTRVLILLDDIPALQADAGFPNWNDFPVENIAQIEVLKGASSVMYGSSAMNGIINIRTGMPTDKPETLVSIFGNITGNPQDISKKWWTSSPFEIGASLLHKQTWKKLDLVAGGLLRKNESFNKGTYERYGRGSLHLRYRFGDRLSVGVHTIINPGANSDFFYWSDAGAGAMIGDSSAYSFGHRLRFNIDPYLTWFDRSGGRHKILSRYYYVNNQNNENRSNTSRLQYLEYQYTKHLRQIGLDLSTGIVSQSTAISAELYGDTVFTSSNYALYLQLEKRLFRKLLISVGGRYEYNEQLSPEQVLSFEIPGGKTIDRKPVFRAGANYEIGRYSTLRAAWGQGYRYPTVAERFINTALGPVAILPNPPLQAETGWSGEIGYKQGLKWGDWRGFGDIALFWQEYDNMMEFLFTFIPEIGFGFQSQNIGATLIRGVDFTVSGIGKIGEWNTAILAGYNYIDPRYRAFTEQDSITSSAKRNILKYRFQHTAKIDFETGKSKYRLGIALRYYSFMENIDAILEEIVVPGLKQYREDNQRGFTIVDLRCSYQWSPLVKTTFLIQNALNLEYSIRPGLLEQPRNYTIRVDFSI